MDILDHAPIVSILIAVIAALASLSGALSSRSSAKDARIGAERVNSINQQVVALDRGSEELREAYKLFAVALSELFASKNAMGLAAAMEVLTACQAADHRLHMAANDLSAVAFEASSSEPSAVGEAVDELRDSYRACQANLALRREELFLRPMSDLDPWWARFVPK